MTKKEAEALGRRLLPLLPGFEVRGRLLVITPVRQILRAVPLDRCSDPRVLVPTAFTQVLCLPLEYEVLSYGEQLRNPGRGGSTDWHMDDPGLRLALAVTIRADSDGWLYRVTSLREFASRVQELGYNSMRSREAVGYALARMGDYARARVELSEAERLLDADIAGLRAQYANLGRSASVLRTLSELSQVPRAGPPWSEGRVGDLERVRYLLRLIDADPAAAQRQLVEWEQYTIKSLGLADLV